MCGAKDTCRVPQSQPDSHHLLADGSPGSSAPWKHRRLFLGHGRCAVRGDAHKLGAETALARQKGLGLVSVDPHVDAGAPWGRDGGVVS